MQSKRKYPRLDEEWELTYRTLNKSQLSNDPVAQYSKNISGGGVCFMADEEIQENAMLAVELESDQFPASMLALARVVRCKRTRHGYEVACEYWWVGWQNDDAQQSIADYIATVTSDDESTGTS